MAKYCVHFNKWMTCVSSSYSTWRELISTQRIVTE